MSLEDFDVGRSPDPVDAGSSLAEAERVVVLAEQRLRARRDCRPLAAGEVERYCVDCGELIPAERLKHLFIRCVPCQTIVERERRLGLRSGSD